MTSPVIEMRARPQNAAVFLREMQRHDFLSFLDRAWPYITGGDLLDANWHIDAMAYQLGRVQTGACRRLLVNLPPRNAKSKTASVIWVAWMLGQDPSLSFVCVSYSNELSGNLARDCLTIMQAPWYRELFPRTALRREAMHDIQTTAGGGRLATSISGSLTGRGGDIIILDDVIKPEEASSEVVREAVNRWYKTTLASRLNDKRTGAIICVMQRLHQYDLPGMLIETRAWDQLSLPAIATSDEVIPLTHGRRHLRRRGDILHPAREPLRELERLRVELGSTVFEAQYQQSPVPAQGNTFKARWLKTDDGAGAPAHGEIIQSWDTGIKTGDGNSFSVCITARSSRRRVDLIDVWRGRLEFPDLAKKAVELARLHGARTLLIEDRASGSELIQTLRSDPPHGVPLPIPCQPTSDKLSRAEGVSSIVEAGQLFLPPDAHWLGEFKAELLAFPSGRYDDQVDALTQLLAWLRDRWSIPAPENAGPILITEEGSTGEGDYLGNIDDIIGDPWAA